MLNYITYEDQDLPIYAVKLSDLNIDVESHNELLTSEVF